VQVATELLASAGATLDGVELALSRLEGGSYGRCEECGSEIGDDVLAVAPTADCCADHDADRCAGHDEAGDRGTGPA
jgi:RNA polymerase-binding transcription factor DksA